MNGKKGKEGKQLKLGPAMLLSGYKDRLPSEAPYYARLDDLLASMAADYGFVRVETPVVEDARLYVGQKNIALFPADELITWALADGSTLALRPHHSFSLARAYREHGYANLSQPMKLFAQGPQFRNVAHAGGGTYRQFHLATFHVFGDEQPVLDAQMIAALYFVTHELGLDVRLHLNSMGHQECRSAYEKLLLDYFRARRASLCEACKERVTSRQALALLTCPEPTCQDMQGEAPQIVDHLCEADREHFVHVLEHLDAVDVSYLLDPRLVRNPTLANRTVARIDAPLSGREPITLATAGRLDQLVAATGGASTPVFGLGLGLERTVLAMREQGIPAPTLPPPDIFLAQLGEAARRKSLKLFLQLRTEGVRVAESLSKEGIKGQLEYATQLRAKFALILGQKEIMDGTILIRDMENGIQEILDFQKVIPEVKKRLAKAVPASIPVANSAQ